MFDNKYIELAYKLAKKACRRNEVPIGCVIIHQHTVIASSYNTVEQTNCAINHAEIIAINKAMIVLESKYLNNCDMYVTLEPCPMCAYAISLAKVRRLYFSVEDKKSGGVLNGPKIFQSSSTHHSPEVIDSIMYEKHATLLKNFFIKLRAKNE